MKPHGLHDTTLDAAPQATQADGTDVALTIVAHPDPRRIGDVARLPDLGAGAPVAVSRLEPLFVPPRGGDPWPLADPHLSRKPVRLLPTPGGVAVHGEDTRTFSDDEVDDGVVLVLGGHVALLLHRLPAAEVPGADLGIHGESAAVQRLRRMVLRVADVDVPVLLRGQTGSGKELVAQAIHAAGPRAAGPCVCVNMAAIAPATASSELFGHVRGAFTGAVADHDGCFARAHRGTLFLDEIGEAPLEVQPMLLRALETRSVQPLGAHGARAVDVRFIAATDVDLDAAVAAGRFRPALLHRLAGYEIDVPSLRRRRDDIARLLLRFVGEELARVGEEGRLQPAPGQPSWLDAKLVARLVRYDWPGNVRQLRNVARQLVLSSRGLPRARVDDVVRRLLEIPAEPNPRNAASRPERPRRKPADISAAELLEALRAARWRIEPAAAALGLTPSSLHMLIERTPGVRRARDVPQGELERSFADHGGDLDRMSAALEVSPRGLKLRLRELGIR